MLFWTWSTPALYTLRVCSLTIYPSCASYGSYDSLTKRILGTFGGAGMERASLFELVASYGDSCASGC